MTMYDEAESEVKIAEHLSFICTLDGVHTIAGLRIPYCTKLQYVFDSTFPLSVSTQVSRLVEHLISIRPKLTQIFLILAYIWLWMRIGYIDDVHINAWSKFISFIFICIIILSTIKLLASLTFFENETSTQF